MADWRHEKQLVADALGQLLPSIGRPWLAMKVAEKLSPKVGLPEPRVRKILLWLAKEGHPHATHDGGQVKHYGRIVTLWRWHPAPQRIEEGSIEARLIEAGAIDTSEW